MLYVSTFGILYSYKDFKTVEMYLKDIRPKLGPKQKLKED